MPTPVCRRPALLAAALALAAASLPSPAAAQAKFGFDVHGYYRARGVMFGNLYDDEHPLLSGAELSLPLENPELTTYLVQRGRLEPEISLGKSLFVKAQIDVFDNVVWGDNENLTATPLFAADPSNTQTDGTVVDSIKAKRFWAEWNFMFGQVRVGRQGSQWGMGILANDGNGFDVDFGDKNFGATYDRFMFITKPIELARGLYGLASGRTLKPREYGLIVGVGFDKLVESSQVSYYTRFDDTQSYYQKDPVTGEYIESARYSPIWLSDEGDDVHEMVYVLALKRDNMPVGPRGADIMDLTVGAYAVNRFQGETDSNVWILDGYLNWRWRGAFVQSEGYWITGYTKAIGAGGATKDTTQDCAEQIRSGGHADSETNADDCKVADIKGFVARAGYENPLLTGLFEVGYASGDNDLRDPQFTGRALHPDHGVGLILYRQVLAAKTAQAFVGDPDYKGLWSNGGVYNSVYINPRFKIRPTSFLEFRLGFLTAWVDRVDGGIIPYLSDEERNTYVDDCDDPDEGEGTDLCDGKVATDRNLGIEIDAGIYMNWAEDHVLIAIEGGWLHAGRRLGLTSGYAETEEVPDDNRTSLEEDPGIARRLNNPWTLQVRFAVTY